MSLSCLLFFIQLEYKKGHEERVSKYTTVTDTPDVLLAKNQGKIVSDVSEWNIYIVFFKATYYTYILTVHHIK